MVELAIRDGTIQWLSGAMAPLPPTPTFGKKILICILTKRILILVLKFIYLAPPSQKIYKMTQEIQQINNKKNLLKKKNAHIQIIRKSLAKS